ncbi:nucleotidyltransferase [Clostridium botulinum]|uniref:Nucleotidyltransferase n=1 Tax=Clostridium botulinum C/D str. DC5 TaxID=1443128 RepID=A0A0A0IFG9_CLOBO|nr:nucleotidyltransferase domain-containing protein [Clostridium botulinum]KEI03793.1 nucleotidyltransferase [Clostridium botulinum C/D str. BKT75002]KEI09001.1 nucleotidyltransferase [Clostridium botulinum C/D str. BKT2873]KGM99268.1 nucleotidyltransferase [Clostridium botulinum C/D str. DC5]KOC50544.1 nucleotidyltransferase [Clostridium botulinum]KOC55037.1 nucleotidyltransferase [Clostridium botulinum]
MLNNIEKYQRAFSSLINKLKNNEAILAAMVFGSVLTGDLWEGSDIDLFVICKNKINNKGRIYTEEEGIKVHIKLISKEKFLTLYDEELAGGFIHRVFLSSRLVFSKDDEVTSKYDIGRYYPDIDREKWNMVYFSDLLKSIEVCKKYLANNGTYMAYSSAIKAMEDFSKLYVNSSGYMISKDVMTMATNLNDKLRELADKLFFATKENMYEIINEVINFLEEDININIKKYIALLLEFMKDQEIPLSSEDILVNKLFDNLNIRFERLLNRMLENGIIKRKNRNYKDEENNVLISENVYFI